MSQVQVAVLGSPEASQGANLGPLRLESSTRLEGYASPVRRGGRPRLPRAFAQVSGATRNLSSYLNVSIRASGMGYPRVRRVPPGGVEPHA